MPEQPSSRPENVSSVQANLLELSRVLRSADHLKPAAQRALADLVDELAKTLGPSATQEQTANLGASAAQLVRALHERQHVGLLTAAKKRLEDAAAKAETKAPVATGVARRLIDLLAELGI